MNRWILPALFLISVLAWARVLLALPPGGILIVVMVGCYGGGLCSLLMPESWREWWNRPLELGID